MRRSRTPGWVDMEDLEALVALLQSPEATPAEKHYAFGELAGRFQDMAYGYAYALLGDPHLAQDAAQEAFISAYRNLGQLQEPRAFPGWFRRIVLTQCHRLTRGRRLPTRPISASEGLASSEPGPAALVEAQELRERIVAAVRGLPEEQRLATVLYYIDGYSQDEVARFLEVSAPAVRKRLQRARTHLRERMLDMVRDNLQAQRPSRDERFLQALRLSAALDVVALESQLTTLEALLVDGLDVNARSADGGTLLHWAAQKGHLEAVELLLKSGADPTVTDRLGKTPLQWAVEAGHRPVAERLRRQGRRGA